MSRLFEGLVCLAVLTLLKPVASLEGQAAGGQPITPRAESSAQTWRFEEPFDGAVSALLSRRSAVPGEYRLLSLDRQRLTARLSERAAGTSEVLLPLADGRLERFAVRPSPSVPPELAARYPSLRIFRARGIDDPSLTASLSDLEQGFSAWIRSPAGLTVVEPTGSGDSSSHLVYRRADIAQRGLAAFQCEARRERPVASIPHGGLQSLVQAASTPVPAPHRTYVLALAATGEYTQFHGGTVSAALAEMATAIDRVNTIFEPEIGVTLVLHPSTDALVFTNAATDPYSMNLSAMLNENQSVLDSVIGNANFDLGHVFSAGPVGGLASISSVCWSSPDGGRGPEHAKGVTRLTNPTGDPFFVDYVAHELGHQFGADHTFNSTAPATPCSDAGQRVPELAFEPGSGSTIMAYAGLCAPEDLQSSSDPYFHFSSLSDIEVYIADSRPTWGGDPACVDLDVTGNMTPSVNAGPDRVIPVGTPFALVGTATDDIGVARFVWEQADLGTGSAFGIDDGVGPLFRSRLPSSSPRRVFPRMATILQGVADPAEVLPQVGRSALTFKLIARDDDARGGGWGIDEMEIEVDAGSGPFSVVSPNGGETVTGSLSVEWNVANTAAAPVACASVDVLLSLDGGASFPSVLLAGTPNDGAADVGMPPTSTARARLMVRCSTNVFFDVSDDDFAVAPTLSLPFGDGFESGNLVRWSTR